MPVPDDKNPQPPRPAPSREVAEAIRQQFPGEYLEAVFEEATQIWRSHQDGDFTTIVITPRRVAVILDKLPNRGVVVPVEAIYARIDAAVKARIETWLAAPTTRFHVIQVPGSWFFPYVHGTRIPIADVNVRSTNMTYDTGPRP
jgi:hypothetical protein